MIDLHGDEARLYIVNAVVQQPDAKVRLLFEYMPAITTHERIAQLLAQVSEHDGMKSNVARLMDIDHLSPSIRLEVALILSSNSDEVLRDESITMLASMIPGVISQDYPLSLELANDLVVAVRRSSTFSSSESTELTQALQLRRDEGLLLPRKCTTTSHRDLLLDEGSLEGILEDTGPSDLSSLDALVGLLSEFVVDEAVVARCIGMMANFHLKNSTIDPLYLPLGTDSSEPASELDIPQGSAWDLELFVEALHTRAPSLNWDNVCALLDYPGFQLHDNHGFKVICNAYSIATGGKMFPVHTLVTQWSNQAGQLSIIECAISAPASAVDFEGSALTSQALLSTNVISAMKTSPGLENGAWCTVELIEALLRNSQSDLFCRVQNLFNAALEVIPETILSILSQVSMKCALKDQIQAKLLPRYMDVHTNSSLVLTSLWKHDSDLVVEYMIRLYMKDPTFLSRVLDIAQDLKVMEALAVILKAKPFLFAIDLATLASRREFLNLEKWLQIRVTENGFPFIVACVDFLKEYAGVISGQNETPRLHCISLISWDTVKVFFDLLNSNYQLLPKMLVEEVNAIYGICKSSAASTTPASSLQESIEQVANSYFQKIYDSSLQISDMVDVLRTFMSSTDAREVQIYNCMIHSLFDEYRFFRKYPDKELNITGVLFGALISKDLLKGANLDKALQYVFESLQGNAPDHKLYKFGIWALEQFLGRCSEFPNFYRTILSLSHFQKANPDMFKALGAQMSVSEIRHTKITNEILLRSKGDDVWFSLEEGTRERILLVLNSIGSGNIAEKSSELRNLLSPDQYVHFAQYLVAKRVSKEQNNHSTYIAMLTKFDSPEMFRCVTLATYHNINFLLKSDLVLSAGAERNLLKTLALFLGEITIARNRPCVAKYLDLRKLLIEAFAKDRLQAVIPLVCKILLSCEKSKVFRPPNPWLMSMLAILVEANKMGQLKLNTRFEIEVLLNKLQMELDDVPLRNHFPKALEKSDEAGSSTIVDIVPPVVPSVSTASTADETVTLPTMQTKPRPQSIYINPELQHPQLAELVELALKNAVQESISPVVERSANIACITANELIRKDFALEPSEVKMRQSAHLMVQYLTGNLAIFTGRELLRSSFAGHLQALFIKHQMPASMVDSATRLIVEDNLDLACVFLERAAWEHSAYKIDDQLFDSYQMRRTHRENSKTPFYDANLITAESKYPAALPEVLRPKGGLTPQQVQVYADFATLMDRSSTATASTPAATPAAPAPTPAAAPVQTPVGTASPVSEDMDPTLRKVMMAEERLDYVLSKLDEILADLPKGDPSLVLSNASLTSTIKNVSAIFFRLDNPHRQDLAIVFSRKVFAMLFDSVNPLQMDICLMLLKAVRIACNDIAKDLTMLLISAIEDRVLNMDAVVGLLREGLVMVAQLDVAFAKMLSSGTHRGLLDIILEFVDTVVVMEKIVAPSEFARTLGTFNEFASHAKQSPLSEKICLLLDRVRQVLSARSGPNAPSADTGASQQPEIKSQAETQFSQRCFLLFDEWLSCYLRQPGLPEKLLVQFIDFFEREGMLKSPASIEEFFRVVVPPCIDISQQQSGDGKSDTKETRYEFVDSLAKLVLVLTTISRTPVAGGVENLQILSIFLNVVAEVFLSRFDSQKERINFAPFHRLFTSLSTDLCVNEGALESNHVEILLLFARCFHALQPAHIPVFCFNWLQLVSHKSFMAPILLTKDTRCLIAFQVLLVDLFKFMERFLRKAQLTDSILHLYRGTLRVLLVLLHDFPEFLCEFHFSLCDVIPPACVQMRNLILSAFPRNMRLPDPFLPNLKVDLLPEIKQDPKLRSELAPSFAQSGAQGEIERFLANRGPQQFFVDLVERLYLNPEQAMIRGTVYNVPLINSMVMFVGQYGIKHLQRDSTLDGPSASMEIFQGLVTYLDEEGRYYFLNAIANQLRYPNTHTHYFSCTLLYLFGSASSEMIQEQITK